MGHLGEYAELALRDVRRGKLEFDAEPAADDAAAAGPDDHQALLERVKDPFW